MTDNRTTELLPCPICGGQPDFQHFNITPNVQGRIVCSCGIELRQGKNDTEDDMRIIWNTRSDYAVQAENERKVEQAIAATLGNGTLTAEQVRTAIFNGSSYASYDGAKYYADGINMQAIADELNARAERTCEWQLEHSGTLYDKWRCSECGYLFVESRTDHGIKNDFNPNYCPNCGAKVIE